ncbi:T9SS type A sorting domain-containing protein [Psychroserpens sp.]
MKYILLFFLILPIVSFSQCPPTSGVFTTQAQIDALAIDYPDCNSVSYLTIEGDDITDLSGLSQITTASNIRIQNNPLLESLNGFAPNFVIFNTYQEGNGLRISNNASLTDISALETLVNQSMVESTVGIINNPMLTSLEGLPDSFNTLTWFSIVNNDALTNLNGIANYSPGESITVSDNDGLIDLTGLGGFGTDRIRISNNANLQSLDGSEFLYYFDQLSIEDNQSLTDISAIWVGSWLTYEPIIRNNPNLSMCSSQNVCDYFTNMIEEYNSLGRIFENNAPGCNSVLEAGYGCGINSNDDCGSTTYSGFSSLLLELGETIQANNEFATTSEQTPSCNDVPNRKDVWFAFNSGASTIIDVTVGLGFYLQLWNANVTDPFYLECGNQTQLANACGSDSLFDIAVTPDTYYLVQVWNDDVADRGGSSWFDLTVQDGALSTQEFQFEKVKLFPNPVNDVLNIQSDEPKEKVEIFNLLGKRIKELNSGTNMNTIDMSDLAKGMYLIQVSINGKESTYKVLKN